MHRMSTENQRICWKCKFIYIQLFQILKGQSMNTWKLTYNHLHSYMYFLLLYLQECARWCQKGSWCFQKGVGRGKRETNGKGYTICGIGGYCRQICYSTRTIPKNSHFSRMRMHGLYCTSRCFKINVSKQLHEPLLFARTMIPTIHQSATKKKSKFVDFWSFFTAMEMSIGTKRQIENQSTEIHWTCY